MRWPAALVIFSFLSLGTMVLAYQEKSRAPPPTNATQPCSNWLVRGGSCRESSRSKMARPFRNLDLDLRLSVISRMIRVRT